MNPLLRKLIRRSVRGLEPRELAQAGKVFRAALGAVAAPAKRPDVSAHSLVSAGAASMLNGRYHGPGGIRPWHLYVPEGARSGGPLRPLVVMLHGCKQDALDFAVGTGMNREAERRGWFVLYPEQAPRSNAQRCWNWFQPGDQRRGRGEPALIAGMVHDVLARHPVDPQRVYVAGLSAGGSMAAILAREYPDLFAAAGVHSGLEAGAAHDVASAFAAMRSGPAGAPGQRDAARAGAGATPDPHATLDAWAADPYGALSAPVGDPSAGAPTIVFHGDADAVVAPLNGRRVVDASLGGAERWQVERSHGTASLAGRGWTRHVYRDAGAGAGGDAPSRAELWIVHGGSHGWSGGQRAGSYTDPTGPDATREMARFFAEHALATTATPATAAA